MVHVLLLIFSEENYVFPTDFASRLVSYEEQGVHIFTWRKTISLPFNFHLSIRLLDEADFQMNFPAGEYLGPGQLTGQRINPLQ